MICYLYLDIGVYGTIWILLIAYVTRFLPYGMRYVSTSMLQIHKELEESAAMSGASWALTFRRVVLPLLKPGLLAGWIYVVIVSIRELSSSILLYSPGTEVVSIMIWELWQNGQYVELSALGVMLIIVLFCLVMVAQFVGKRFGISEGLTKQRGWKRAESQIALHGISERQGTVVKAAQDVSFEVPEGKLFTLLGPSGCGKTTTLRSIAGLERPTSGEIEVGGAHRLFLEPRHLRRAEQAQFRHGVPVLRDLAAHERVPERRLPARGAQDRRRRRSARR